MPLAPHQKSVALIMWARLLGYISVAFFALPLTAALGWKRVMPHQIEIGLVGFVFFFWLGQRILRYLPADEIPEQPPTVPKAKGSSESAQR